MRGSVATIFMSGLFGPLMVLGQIGSVEKQVDYFQQQVDHTIAVRLDDAAHMLHAHTSFVYTNNSSVALDTLWIHLWPNAYRDKYTALCKQKADAGELDLHFAAEEERGWIDSLDFSVDGARATWGYHPLHGDIAWLKLSTALATGSQTTIATPFRVKIPDGKFSRLGHTGQAYYITQWYPKPAVFDATGWHAMPYLNQGEFYSEFGSFDVSITLPANYVVGATGLLQTPTERDLMDRMGSSDWQYPQPLRDPYSGKPQLNQFPVSSEQMKTLRYVQDNIHDFAWFADKRFVVRKSEVALPRSGRTVKTWALFTPKNAPLWSDAVSYVNESVRFYSERVGDYPYGACTAIDGTISAGGGMEYPMITIIGDMSDKQSLDNVIAHEVGHNWFYGILGSNERDHAWMDEGMNSFVELQYMRKRYPSGGITIGGLGFLSNALGPTNDGHRLQNEWMYRFNARRNLDQAISITSADFTSTNYGCMVYSKTSLVFDHLLAYLGEETMERCMHAYFEEWKFKHPQPGDVRKVFERESSKSLGWIFEDLIKSDYKWDLKGDLYQDDGKWQVRSLGPSILPMQVTALLGEDSLGTVWTHPKDLPTATVDLPWSTVDRIRIDAGNRTLDIDRRNNEVRSHGLFRRWAKPELKFLLGAEKNDRRSVYWTPLPAWNGNDGWQLGAALHNISFPSQPTEWVVAPLYGFASERWGGAARIEHHFDRMQSTFFQNITIGLSGRSASTFRDHEELDWYYKASPYVNFELKRDPLNTPWQHGFGLRAVYLNSISSSGFSGLTTTNSSENIYAELTYRAEDKRKLHRTLILPTVTYEYDFVRTSLELRRAFALNAKNDEIRLRAFAGTFLWKRDDRLYNGLHAWGLSWGTEDMLYDHAYLERNARDQFTQRQYNTQQGAFKTPFQQGGSETWIGAINLEIDVPVPLPLAVFASAGVVPITTVTQEGRTTSTATYFEGGIGVTAIRDVLEIWFPLVVSQRIADEEEFLDRSVTDRIRFIFAFDKLDPTRAVRRLKP